MYVRIPKCEIEESLITLILESECLSLSQRYALSKRKYLGPTSMDHEMAFLMCTMGHVRAGSFVLDPFVGTGSILVSAAHFGAITMGTDIDIRVSGRALRLLDIARALVPANIPPNACIKIRLNEMPYTSPRSLVALLT